MLSSNILQRVFCLRLGNEQATGFTIEVDGRQYLITAKHFIASSPSAEKIEILRDHNWHEIKFKLISVEPDNVDIAVLALDRQLSPLLPIQIGVKGSMLSQEIFFAGFPYGLMMSDGGLINGGFPLPLVRHGILASLRVIPNEPFLIDGINNPGFSGSPVVRPDSTANPTIIGVISGYRAEWAPIYLQGKKTDAQTQQNTGLIIAYEIDNAIEAIKKNPIGYKISTQQ